MKKMKKNRIILMLFMLSTVLIINELSIGYGFNGLNTKLVTQENRVEAFDNLIVDLGSITDKNEKMQKIDAFITEQTPYGFPIIHSDTVVFIYRTHSDTNVVVEVDGRILGGTVFMDQVENTDLFYTKMVLDSDAAGIYGFLVNSGARSKDPLNNRTIICCGFKEMSPLEMPEFKTDRSYDFNIDIGSLVVNYTLTSNYTEHLINDYTVQVYLPAGYDNSSNTRYKTVYFADGIYYLYELQAQKVLDYLAYNDKTEPIIGVFITQKPEADRESDLQINRQNYAKFIGKEVVPFIDSKYNTVNDSNSRAFVGFSQAGFFSLYIVAEYPEIFKLAGAQSPDLKEFYSVVSGSDYTNLGDFYAGSDKIENTRFYINGGTYDRIVSVQKAYDLSMKLAEKGYEGKFRAFHQTHDNAHFRSTISEMLIFLFTDEPSDYSGSPIKYGNINNNIDGFGLLEIFIGFLVVRISLKVKKRRLTIRKR